MPDFQPQPTRFRSFSLITSWTTIGILAGCMNTANDNPRSTESRSATQHESNGRATGKAQATKAIAAGTLLLKEYPPLPSPPAHSEYVALLRTRCGVEYRVPRPAPGTDVKEFTAEVRGWNAVMETEIRRRFGDRILDDLRQEARQQWQSKLR